MKPAPQQKKLLRCAVYTRKSTDHNLDLEFNSLDAQREACEACIKSQAHEGWRALPSRYDDGAFSGASLERPALQALLTEISSGKIDIVVVYKVDRLTRSLADFAKLVELFDQHSVSFVSVTQSFNTTSSMGRLTLNVLLSFAQFEREVIGERVRDKIAASKRKGIWVGGPIPLGYASVGKKLVVVPEHADRVRTIFDRYLELGSLSALADNLNHSGIRTKQRKSGGEGAGMEVAFSTGALAYLLKNRIYLGQVVYRGEVFRGDHTAIIDLPLFEAVQARLAAQAVERQVRLREISAILTGRIFDDRGNRMTPTHSNKRGVRYRYYASRATPQSRAKDAGVVVRVSAPDIEQAVIEAIRAHTGRGNTLPLETDDRELVEHQLENIIVKPGALEIQLKAAQPPEDSDTQDDKLAGTAAVTVTLPWSVPTLAAVKGIAHTPSTAELTPQKRDAVLSAIARSKSWMEDLTSGAVSSLTQIAVREGKVERHIRSLAALAFVSPGVIASLLSGAASGDMTVTRLADGLPYSWSEQSKYF
jgi:DNA invertase Pin-like site-specific DNA recombinase